MLVGRTQGRRIAEMAFADTHSRQTQVQAPEDEFKLDYDLETKDEKPDVKLQPAPPPPPPPPAKSTEPKATAAKAPAPSRTAAATPAKSALKPATEAKETYLQVFSTNSQKQANSELNRVQSKGFKAKVVKFTKNNVLYHRVIVGPYKDSELDLAKSDLKAKGFKDVIVHK
jgi:DedD protein